MGLIALGWLIVAIAVFALLAFLFPTFRELLSLGTWKAPPKQTRAERAAARRSARLGARSGRDAVRVRVGLDSANGMPEESVRVLLRSAVPKERWVEVRRYQDQLGRHTVAEFDVIAQDAGVAVRVAGRIVANLGLRPGPAHVVPS